MNRPGTALRILNPISESIDERPAVGVQQTLENIGDAQYLGTIRVGGQELKTVFDTGSFELLVMSGRCEVCLRSSAVLYNDNLSQTFQSLQFVSQHSFGSGTTWSDEALERVEIGGLAAGRQHFWEVVEADMPNMQDRPFQALLGLGPPKSALKFAELAAQAARDEEARYAEQQQEVPDAVRTQIGHYYEAEIRMRNATSFAESLQLHGMSVCLGRAPGSPGYFAFGDRALEEEPQKFRTLSVAGDTYWSTNLSDVVMGEEDVPPAAAAAGDGGGLLSRRPRLAGCGEGRPCSAVVDTGTSLLVAPRAALVRIFEALSAWEDGGGNCSDLAGLPDLKFKLNGEGFSLPPESYIGQISGQVAYDIERLMPALRSSSRRWSRDGCVPLIMGADAETQNGEMWVLGMPFFRKYFTSFRFAPGKDGRLEAASISMAVADEACRPASVTDSLVRDWRPQKRVPLQVDGTKLRMPEIFSRQQVMPVVAGPVRSFIRV